jgi:hypothetical protein
MKSVPPPLNLALLQYSIAASAQHTFGASGEPPDGFEPHTLPPALVEGLTSRSLGAVKRYHQFQLHGLTLSVEHVKDREMLLSFSADHELNLWSGRPGEIASAHMGTLEILTKSVVDQDGRNIFDNRLEKPWSSRIPFYHYLGGKLVGLRTLGLKKRKENAKVLQVTGKLKFRLPANVTKYEVKPGLPWTLEPLRSRPDIYKVTVSNGIYIKHPCPSPDFDACIIGYDQDGARVRLVSGGSDGTLQDNHWYNFSPEKPFKRMDIFIPEKFESVEVPFLVDLPEI